MKLYAHVGLDGEIQGLITVPDEKLTAMLVPSPGAQVYEIQNHGLKSETPIEDVEKLLKSHTVDVTSPKTSLVPRKK